MRLSLQPAPPSHYSSPPYREKPAPPPKLAGNSLNILVTLDLGPGEYHGDLRVGTEHVEGLNGGSYEGH